jgi:hypothetical protein
VSCKLLIHSGERLSPPSRTIVRSDYGSELIMMSRHQRFDVLVEDVHLAKAAIADCRDMEGFEEHCQVMIKANNGFDFKEFFLMLSVIAATRLPVQPAPCPPAAAALPTTAGVEQDPAPSEGAFLRTLRLFELKQIASVLNRLKCAMEDAGQSAELIMSVVDLAAEIEAGVAAVG